MNKKNIALVRPPSLIGGFTYQSEGSKEYTNTLNKAQALFMYIA